MLDNEDIQKLKEIFATEDRIKEMLKENNKSLLETFSAIFPTKTDFEDFKQEYRQEFDRALNPIDKKVGQEVDDAQEKIMLEGKVKRHEKWINQIAVKVDLKLES